MTIGGSYLLSKISNMRCPCCKEELVITHQDRYESLDVHVSGGRVSLKDGYQCLNDYCVANNVVATWINDGDIFVDPPVGINSSVALAAIKKSSSTGMVYALDSWSNSYNKMLKEKELTKTTIDLHFYKLKLTRKFKSNDDGTYKKRFAWNLKVWKRDKNGYYVHHMSFLRMFLFVLNDFDKNLPRALLKRSHEISRCLERVDRKPPSMTAETAEIVLERQDDKDNRDYAVAASLYIKIFRCNDVKRLRKAYKELVNQAQR